MENMTPRNEFRGFYKLRAGAKPGTQGCGRVQGEGTSNSNTWCCSHIIEKAVAFDSEFPVQIIPVGLFGVWSFRCEPLEGFRLTTNRFLLTRNDLRLFPQLQLDLICITSGD